MYTWRRNGALSRGSDDINFSAVIPPFCDFLEKDLDDIVDNVLHDVSVNLSSEYANQSKLTKEDEKQLHSAVMTLLITEYKNA